MVKPATPTPGRRAREDRTMAERLIDLKEVADRFSMSRRWVQTEIEAGRFPRPSIPAKSGSGKNLWREAVIDAEIRRRCGLEEPQDAA